MTRGQLLFLAGYLSLTTAASWLLPLWPVLGSPACAGWSSPG